MSTSLPVTNDDRKRIRGEHLADLVEATENYRHGVAEVDLMIETLQKVASSHDVYVEGRENLHSVWIDERRTEFPYHRDVPRSRQ